MHAAKKAIYRWVRTAATGILAAALCMAGGAAAALAAQGGDSDTCGSITVTLSYEDKPVGGGALELYRLSDWNGIVGLLDDLAKNAASDGTAHKLGEAELAEACLAYAQQTGVKGTECAVPASGTTTFADLESGLYLVVQTQAAEGFYAVNPFVVQVPSVGDDGTVTFDVDATPKVDELLPLAGDATDPEPAPDADSDGEAEPAPGVDPDEEPEPVPGVDPDGEAKPVSDAGSDGDLVQTGDGRSTAAAEQALLAGLGALGLSAAAALTRRPCR